jgi:hypothetical protein
MKCFGICRTDKYGYSEMCKPIYDYEGRATATCKKYNDKYSRLGYDYVTVELDGVPDKITQDY